MSTDKTFRNESLYVNLHLLSGRPNVFFSSIVEARGYSCNSKGINPLSYYYNYKGETASNGGDFSHIYFFSNPGLETDPTMVQVSNSFLPGINHTNATEDFYDFLALDILNPVKNITLINFINFLDVANASGSYAVPKILKYTPAVYLSDDGVAAHIAIEDISIEHDGYVYGMLVLWSIIQQDEEEPDIYTNTTIGSRTPPTARQVFQCNDAEGRAAVACMRCAFTNTTSCSLDFEGAEVNKMYVIYLVTANEHPIQMIFAENVTNLSIQILEAMLLNRSVWLIVTAFLFFILN